MHVPEGFSKVFFTNGGADANENAIRMARLHTGRDKVVSAYRSYHGNTGAAVVATGDWRRVPNEYARAHVHHFGPYLYRSEFWATTPEQESERALHHLERVIQAEGPGSVASILLETIPGTAGVLVPPPGYLAGVRAIADRYGILLILDEVMAGFGRTGQWFAFDSFDVVPDLITFAKGVNSGYVPAGGVILSEPIAKTFDDRVFPGGLTYSGHPLAMGSKPSPDTSTPSSFSSARAFSTYSLVYASASGSVVMTVAPWSFFVVRATSTVCVHASSSIRPMPSGDGQISLLTSLVIQSWWLLPSCDPAATTRSRAASGSSRA